jgi:hypothetical protein
MAAGTGAVRQRQGGDDCRFMFARLSVPEGYRPLLPGEGLVAGDLVWHSAVPRWERADLYVRGKADTLAELRRVGGPPELHACRPLGPKPVAPATALQTSLIEVREAIQKALDRLTEIIGR